MREMDLRERVLLWDAAGLGWEMSNIFDAIVPVALM
jgi:hypothetical protein